MVSTAVRAETLQFSVLLHDEAGAPISARVLVRDAAGRSHVPPVAVTSNLGPDTWFACDGRARLDVPAGTYDVRVEHGPEFRPQALTLALDRNTTHEFRVARWIDLQARGYRSGENHLHIPVGTLPAFMRAEGLDFGSSLSWWNGPYFSPPASDGPLAGRATWFDSEVENDWGALYSIGLPRPMPVAWDPKRPNLAFAAAARDGGAVNCYQGGWSREALLDALLGYVDVINIGDNLFHRFKFMPRTRYSNLLGVSGLPTYPATDQGMLQLATESYYRLLNCGLHLAAGAGTAAGVKSSPAGYNRAYVKVGPDATVRDFLEAWRRGRNFVTNGPMLFLTADTTHEPGDTLSLPAAGGEVRVRAEALSDQPLRSLTIVVNGRSLAQAAAGAGVVETTVRLTAGAWIAACATAEDQSISEEELGRFREESRLGGEAPSRLQFAHTSPIYVDVGGAGAHVPSSVAEARRMLDAFADFVHENAAPEFQAEMSSAIARARERL